MRLVVPLQKSYNPPFVRILLLSDIHSNLEALDSCLAAAPAYDLVARLATLWTRDQLTPKNLDWLRGLPQGPIHVDELPGIQFVHGSPLDEDEYMVSARDAIEPLITIPVPFTFFGHTHLRGGFVLTGENREAYHPGYRSVRQPESSY